MTSYSHVHQLYIFIILDVDDRDRYGRTALHRAAGDGDLEAAENLIIQQGADVNAKINLGWGPQNLNTPLHQAAISGHKDVVGLLLNHSAEVNAKNGDGLTALHKA